jgi:predicted nucleic acid-binding protein
LIEIVLDASVLLKWLRADDEQQRSAALRLEARFRSGELAVAVPPLLFIEVLNVAGRRWHLRSDALERLAARLISLSFQVRQPPLGSIARWTAQGLTAYDACYVALAEERGTVVVTADERMLTIAGAFARSLAVEEELT